MEDLKREIRRILLGFIAYRDNCIVAARESVKMRMLGTFNGTAMARVFGVSTIIRRYRVAEGQEMEEETVLSKSERKKNRKSGDTKKKQQARKLFEDGDEAMQNMGRRVLLSSDPDRLATFYTPILYNPAVLLLDYLEDENAVEVTTVTARTLMARLNAAHACWKWSRNLSYDVELVRLPKVKKKAKVDDELLSEDVALDKEATKEEKKAYKAKKKELAAAKKNARKKQKLEAKMAKLQASMEEQVAALQNNTEENEE